MLLGYAEQLEYFETLSAGALKPFGGKAALVDMMGRAALATADFHIEHSFADGVPFWDTGAPGVASFGKITHVSSDPYNDVEPLDSSAAAICGQGYLRLGNYYANKGDKTKASRYRAAAFKIAQTLMEEPYMSTDARHQGITLHAIYHRPNGWDYVPSKRKIPCGESAMWGDYHTMELVHLIKREAEGKAYPVFLSRSERMQITAIKPIVARFGNRPRVLVKVETDEGISGWGEAHSIGPDLSVGPVDYCFELIKGIDPRRIEFIMMKLTQFRFPPGNWSLAISAIDHALWDISGKAAGLPVYMLLGERPAIDSRLSRHRWTRRPRLPNRRTSCMRNTVSRPLRRARTSWIRRESLGSSVVRRRATLKIFARIRRRNGSSPLIHTPRFSNLSWRCSWPTRWLLTIRLFTRSRCVPSTCRHGPSCARRCRCRWRRASRLHAL